MRILKTHILLFFLFSVSFAYGKDSTNIKNQIYFGVNPLLPFVGNLIEEKYNRISPLSYISSNRNISFYAEYRRDFFGIKLPVRLPIQSWDLSEYNFTTLNYGYSDPYRFEYIKKTIFEVGLKPVFYLTRPNAKVEMYTGLGIYFGQHSTVRMDIYHSYSFNQTTNLYEGQPPWKDYFISWDEPKSYNRISWVTGATFFLYKEIFVGYDLELFYFTYGSIHNYYFTNLNTSDGIYYQAEIEEYNRKNVCAQFNFNLGYRFNL